MSEKRTKNQAEWDRMVILEGEEHRKREMEAELLGGNLPTPPMLIHEVAKLSGIAFRRDGTDLRLSRRSILLRLFEKSGVSQQSLVEATHLTAATISVELGEMEKEGLPPEAIEGLRDLLDCNVYFFDHAVEIPAMYLILGGATLLLLVAYILLNAFKKKV